MKYCLLALGLLITPLLYASPDKIAENCSEWLDARKQNSHGPSLNWLQGFVAGYNEYKYAGKHPQGVLGTNKGSEVAEWMDNYCQKNINSNPRAAIESIIETRQHVKKGCPVRKQSGRPCIPAKEVKQPELNQ